VRGILWFLVILDLLFRLFYNKPGALKSATHRQVVSRLDLPASSRLEAAPTLMFVIWTRILFIMAEYFEYVDNHPGERVEQPEVFKSRVISFCEQLEQLMDDWPFVGATHLFP
jgi:hypothetical protein